MDPLDPTLATDLTNRFTYHPPKPGQPAIYESIRDQAHAFARNLCGHVPPSRERSLALTKLEEVVMWANAGVARAGNSPG